MIKKSNDKLSAEELGQKLLKSVKEMREGKAARVTRVAKRGQPK